MASRRAPQQTMHEAYARLPLAFEPNQGQADQEVKFLARGRGYTVFLTAGEAVLTLQRPGKRREAAIVRMSLAGARRDIGIEGLDELPGTAPRVPAPPSPPGRHRRPGLRRLRASRLGVRARVQLRPAKILTM